MSLLYVSPDAYFTPLDKPWLEFTRLTENRNGEKVGHSTQHRANTAWAKRMGIAIGAWYKEENISTSDENVVREVWEQILAEIAAGMWGGLLVWRADRLTRQTAEFTRLHKIAKRQRALVATSYDSVTTIDPAGYARMLGQISAAEQEAATTGIRVTANSEERKKRGLYHGGGKRPWCFEAPKHDKRIKKKVLNSGRVGVKHVKAEVELANEAAERIAWDSWTYKDVIDEWHARTPPVYGATGAPWSTTTLRNCLTSPRMIGKVLVERTDDNGKTIKKLKKAQWKPVLQRETWDKLVSQVRTEVHKSGIHRYLLSPILICGRCERRLTGCTRAYKKQGVMVPTRTYRCRSHPNDKARGSCGRLNVIAEPVEDLVKAFIFARLERTRELGIGVHAKDDLRAQIADRDAEVGNLEGELKLLLQNQELAETRLPLGEFLSLRRGYTADLESARAALQSLVQQRDVPEPVGADWDDLWNWHHELTAGQQQKLILAHIRKVVVLPPGRSGRYFKPERVVITASDAEELDGNRDELGVDDLDGDSLIST